MEKDPKLALYERNKAYVHKNYREETSFETYLNREEETSFRKWLASNKANHPALANFDPNDSTMDYDLRGWWLENKDKELPTEDMHFNDKYKTPYHPSFSNESIYANVNAPRWIRNQDTWNLTTYTGKVLVSERIK